jgi:hypothetical protein
MAIRIQETKSMRIRGEPNKEKKDYVPVGIFTYFGLCFP